MPGSVPFPSVGIIRLLLLLLLLLPPPLSSYVSPFCLPPPLVRPNSALLAGRLESQQESQLDSYSYDSRCSSSASSPLRRSILVSTLPTLLLLPNAPALASVTLYDPTTSQYYAPSRAMLTSGEGSLATRGIPLKKGGRTMTSKDKADIDKYAERIYPTRFVVYLTRFLLRYDPPAIQWFSKATQTASTREEVEVSFGELSRSVFVGLEDYFLGETGAMIGRELSIVLSRLRAAASHLAKACRSYENDCGTYNLTPSFFSFSVTSRAGPYGSYSSVPAAVAGLAANATVSSVDTLSLRPARQGVLNLLALLKARYTTPDAKRQLGILFTFVEPLVQPTKEVTSLLGEADDGQVSVINLQPDARLEEGEEVEVETPPALGSLYSRAVAEATVARDGTLLAAAILKGGSGYTR